jgi:hypothetical protein
MNKHSDVDRAIEAEMKRGSLLLNQNIENLREFKEALAKFHQYRKSSKFMKVTFEDFHPYEESDDENLDLDNEKSADVFIDDSGVNATYSLDILSVARSPTGPAAEASSWKAKEQERQEEHHLRMNMPKYLPTSLMFEKVHSRKQSTTTSTNI